MRTTTKLTLVAVSALAALTLAGCSSPKDQAGPTPSDTVTSAPATTPPASSTPAAPSTPATSPSSSTGTSGGAVAACATGNLTGAIGANAGGGAAGSDYVNIVLTNHGSSPCTLQGWPGVSFVGLGNGTQLGQAATLDRTSAHPTVTLAAGGTSKATLRVVQARNYDPATCGLKAADGFRVYPPGQKASLLVKNTDFSACTSTKVSLLTVGAFQ
jgi:hypothetical protein